MLSKAGGGKKIIKVSYHVLGSCIFGFGLLLLVKLPTSHDAILGDLLFNQPANRINMAIRIGAPLLQIIGILLFLKWFSEHGKKEHIKIYKRYEPLILIFLVFLTPIILNTFIDSTKKAFIYAGKSNSDAIEYVKSKSSCTAERNTDLAECVITLRNYNHSSQRVTLKMSLDKLDMAQTVPVYLLRQQEKKVQVELPIDQLTKQELKTNLIEHSRIIID